MVSSPGNTPAKLPFEIITDTLKSIQQDVQALRTSLSAIKDTHQPTHRLVVRAMLGLAGGMLLCTSVLLWWTKPPATPNYTPRSSPSIPC